MGSVFIFHQLFGSYTQSTLATFLQKNKENKLRMLSWSNKHAFCHD